jgi:hypothetical protein
VAHKGWLAGWLDAKLLEEVMSDDLLSFYGRFCVLSADSVSRFLSSPDFSS